MAADPHAVRIRHVCPRPPDPLIRHGGGGSMATVASSRDEILREAKEKFGLVPEWLSRVPDPALPGYWRLLSDFYFAETVIPNKYKDLIGLAVAGVTRCRYCALFHTEGARLAGATDAEIAEASLMGGVVMMASSFVQAEQID